MKWIKTSERLPKYLTNVKVKVNNNEGLGFVDGDNTWYDSIFEKEIQVVEWLDESEEVENNSWISCDDKYPPDKDEILAKAPDGTVYLTNWRPSYKIFSCQEKGADTYNWKWKYI